MMPRRKKYEEHIDDHQVELVQALAAEGRVIPAYEPEDLPGAIMEAMKRQRLEVGGSRREGVKSTLLELVERAIEELENRD